MTAKRLFVFALLLAGGLALLWFLERRQPTAPGTSGDGPAAAPPPLGRHTLEISGEQIWIRFDDAGGTRTGRRSQIAARDSAPTDEGHVRLVDVTIDLIDPRTDTTQAQVTSSSAVVELDQGAEFVTPRPQDEVRLSEVRVEVRGGTRFAPLTVSTPTLVADTQAQRFRTADRAVAVGADLSLEGQGLDFDLPSGRLVFASDAQVTVRAGEGRLGRLASAGALELLRPPGVGSRPVRVLARGRARLALGGPEGLALSADEVEMVGSGDPDREGTFRFQELSARGEVLLLADGNRFRCQEARFVMTSSGALERVRLLGAVDGELDPSSALEEGADAAALDGAGVVRLWGRGPMDLRTGPDGGFDLAGPAELAWAGTRLWADGGLSGEPGGDREPLLFEAWAGVRVERDGWIVRTEHLEGRWTRDAAGASTIALVARDLATADGADRDGAPVQLRARDGFDIELSDGAWRVARAIGVDLVTGGERPLTATAERVLDFTVDPAVGPSFRAEEHVEVIVDGQFLRGSRLEARGLDELVVTSDDGLVELDGKGLHAEARRVRREGRRLVAEGDVRARVERDGLEVALSSARLEATGLVGAASAAGDEDDGVEQALRLRASGSVDATVVEGAGAERIEVRTDDLEVVRQPVRGGELEQTVVRARGAVRARVVGELGDHDLDARELDALVIGRPLTDDRTDEAERAERRGSVEARGAVVVTSRAPTPLSGSGDTFTVDHEGRGTLVADPGRRVRAEGALPGTGRPFDVEGSSIAFEPDGLRIVEPRIHVTDPMVLGGAAEESGNPTVVDLVATCRRLDADAERVVFDGDVSFLGTTAALQTWTLRCARAELTTDPPLEEGAPRRPRDLVASGGVRVVFSEGLRVEGERMRARAFDQRVRVEGSPARLREGSLDFVATYFDIDTLNGLWDSGPGWIGPSTVGDEPAVDEGP